TLAPMLKEDGRLIGDFTLANLGAQDREEAGWFLAGSGIAEQYHMRWFEQHLPDDGSVHIEALGQKLTGLSIAGPRARDVLAKATRSDISNAAFPFMAIAKMDVGMAPC
ncbi:MAG: aminomethyl transferase family protein, partial [Mesorhizobium sp.]